jgi:hypothetical protein
MRRMILRMIATGSLSAFSASVLHGSGALGGTSAPSRPSPAIQSVRSTAQQPPAQQLQAPVDPGKSAAPAGRVPPRGSLLDLSV